MENFNFKCRHCGGWVAGEPVIKLLHEENCAYKPSAQKPSTTITELTDEEKSDMYWKSNTAEGIAPDEDLPMMLKPQAD